jgi:hypothetical protein
VGAKKICKIPDIKTLLISYIEQFKAGSPTDATVFWISKNPKEIAASFNVEYSQTVSNGSIKRILKELGYGYRKHSKQLATGTYCDRDAQFNIITNLILTMSSSSPVISIDCKKKSVRRGGKVGQLLQRWQMLYSSPYQSL